jgi:ferredoxin-thioredoxin reductase catalytic chain
MNNAGTGLESSVGNIPASKASVERMRRFAPVFAAKSGSVLQPNTDVRETVVVGLAKHIDELGRPLCPCNFYPDKRLEAGSSRWICPCEEMQRYKYCHCMLFCGSEGLPITEHLPVDHEGRDIYGLVEDPNPQLGRALSRLEEKSGRSISKSARGSKAP